MPSQSEAIGRGRRALNLGQRTLRDIDIAQTNTVSELGAQTRLATLPTVGMADRIPVWLDVDTGKFGFMLASER